MFYFHRKHQMVIIPHFIECCASHFLQVKQDLIALLSLLWWNEMSSTQTAPLNLEGFQNLASVNHRVNINAGTPIFGLSVLSSPFSTQLLACRGSHMISLFALTGRLVTFGDQSLTEEKHILTEMINFRWPSSGKHAGQSRRSFT